MKEEEKTIDGVKSKIVVDLDDDYIEKLSDDEINEFERTIDLSTITKDLEKTMEINLND